MNIQELPLDELTRRLAAPGLRWRSGPFVVELQATVPDFAQGFQTLYGLHPVADPNALADFHFQLRPGPWYRRWFRPQAWFHADASTPFAPFPGDHALPLLEWGMNWITAARVNHLLLFHAAALERNGRVLLLPARPLSGKSTLAAALALRGWRLFSDEMVLMDPETGLLLPMVRPIALKNASIELIRRQFPHAILGPRFPKTRKGVVAHLRPPPESVAAMGIAARPAWVVAPNFSPNAPTTLSPMAEEARFFRLAGNAFNYEILGRPGFRAIESMTRSCAFFELTFGDLEQALAVLEELTRNEASVPTILEPPPPSPPPAPVGTASALHTPARPPGILLWLVLRDPEQLEALGLVELELVLRLARNQQVLARLGALAQQTPCWPRLPQGVRAAFQSALILAAERRRAVLWELNRVQRALVGAPPTPLILLKGGAYVAAGLELANGRLLADLDLLVAESDLPLVEARLLAAGWLSAKPEAYDQRYYREWMHELPPLRHPERGTEVDLHHAILPRTSRLSSDSRLLLAAAQPCPERPGVWVLHPCDQVLHAAVHLFHDGALEQAVRGLLDIDGLLRPMGADFWPELHARAVQCGLQRPLFYALRYARQWMATPVPATYPLHSGSPAPWTLWLMDWLVRHIVTPRHPERRTVAERVANGVLYIRSHWLRMPLGLLLRHLGRQWWRRAILGERASPNDWAWPPQPKP